MVLTGLSCDFGYSQWPEDVGLTYNLSLRGSCDKFSTLDIHGSRFETFARIWYLTVCTTRWLLGTVKEPARDNWISPHQSLEREEECAQWWENSGSTGERRPQLWCKLTRCSVNPTKVNNFITKFGPKML